MHYEMRTYKIPAGRMDDILERFRSVTFGLFEKYNMDVVGFWTNTDLEEAYELVYLMRYANPGAQEKAWAAFRDDPEWIATRQRTEANGPIVDEVISQNLTPVPFSPMQ
ncbi:MAG: NIPSNAP family protein [Candidatus Latescibacteria bacterium]|nr:NIPSNAP family protein [Candidatus Latescibacterota bacterium]